MTKAQLKKLVTEAVALHRDIAIQNERLKALKADLIHEARLHPKDLAPTNGSGSRWTASGTDGCIVRVNFPAPALLALIDSESETFDDVLALAGECMDQLFESAYYLRPVANFRQEATRALDGRTADKLIDLCETTSAPRVSFETAEQKVMTQGGRHALQKQCRATGAAAPLRAWLVAVRLRHETPDRRIRL